MHKNGDLFLYKPPNLMLAAAMVFGSMSVMAYAAEMMGELGLKYTDVSDAMQPASAGQTVKLLDNAEDIILTVKVTDSGDSTVQGGTTTEPATGETTEF